MLTKVRNFLRVFSGPVHTSTRSLLPKLSGAELARSSWAMQIESYNDVPEVYKSFFAPILSHGRSFPYTILTPSQERFIHRQPEKLISDLDDTIYVLEKRGNGFETLCYPVDGFYFVEFKTALLASSLKICGLTGDGVLRTTTFIFNSVTDYLFTPLLQTVRRVIPNTDDSAEIETFRHLARVNFKFMNYARHSLIPGEKVILSVFQPEILENVITMLGKTFFKVISPAHMLILTDQELIVIQEDAVRRKEDKYGGIWTYIPPYKITSLTVEENGDDSIRLTIQLPENTFFEFLFETSARYDLNQLVSNFLDLYPR